MKVVGPTIQHLLALFGQVSQIRVQNRRTNLTVACAGAHPASLIGFRQMAAAMLYRVRRFASSAELGALPDILPVMEDVQIVVLKGLKL